MFCDFESFEKKIGFRMTEEDYAQNVFTKGTIKNFQDFTVTHTLITVPLDFTIVFYSLL